MSYLATWKQYSTQWGHVWVMSCIECLAFFIPKAGHKIRFYIDKTLTFGSKRRLRRLCKSRNSEEVNNTRISRLTTKSPIRKKSSKSLAVDHIIMSSRRTWNFELDPWRARLISSKKILIDEYFRLWVVHIQRNTFLHIYCSRCSSKMGSEGK